MKHLKLLLLAILVLTPTLCRAADDGYGYPIPGSYVATIMGTPDNLKPEFPKDIPVRQLLLDVTPGLTKPEIFFYDEGLRCTLAYHSRRHHLFS